MNRDERIKQEYERLMDIFQEIDENRRTVAQGLIQEAAFMSILLDDLRDSINAKGTTEKYQNGANQYGYKESAELKSYNATMKNYKAVMDKLLKLAPPVKVEKPLAAWEIKKIEDEARAKEIKEARDYLDAISEKASPDELEIITECRIDAGFDARKAVEMIKERGLFKKAE